MSDWHLDKRINLSHLIATAILVLGGISVVHALDTRLTAVEVKVDALERVRTQQHAELMQAIQRVDAKVDRVIEREFAR